MQLPIINPLILVRRNFPIFNWAREYDGEKFICDLVAGITVGLTLIPQSIAYASLAGLEPQYGLYSSLCGGIIYVFFGTIPEVNIAPTALLSLLTFSFTHNSRFGKVQTAILFCFLSGIIELACGILHLGFLVDFVSIPVVSAFTSAGAITIASSQVKNLLGLKFSAETFTSVWKNVFLHISETHLWDAVLGFSCCFVLLAMRKLKDYGQPPLGKSASKQSQPFKKVIWFLSVARNAFVVIFCSVLAFIFEQHQSMPFSLTPKVIGGLPKVAPPQFQMRIQNETIYFGEMIRELGTGVVAIPFIAIVSNVAIAKAFANGKVVDATQEMIAVGLCNIFGSFFGSYPVNASFSRSAVSSASGVKTPLAGIYAGGMVILAFTFLTPYFSYIPKPTLSAVIICAVLFMIEVSCLKLIWQISKCDMFTFLVTLLSCLFLGIEVGILIGILVDVLMLLYSTARPLVLIEAVKTGDYDYIKVTPSASILFSSAEFLREKILEETHSEHGKLIAIDCSKINKLDYTAAKCMAALISDLNKKEHNVAFFNSKQSIANIIESCCKEVRIYNNEIEMLHDLKVQNSKNLSLPTIVTAL